MAEPAESALTIGLIHRLYTGGLIIGRTFACDLGALFSGGLIFGRAYYRNFTVCYK